MEARALVEWLRASIAYMQNDATRLCWSTIPANLHSTHRCPCHSNQAGKAKVGHLLTCCAPECRIEVLRWTLHLATLLGADSPQRCSKKFLTSSLSTFLSMLATYTVRLQRSNSSWLQETDNSRPNQYTQASAAYDSRSQAA